MNFVRLTKAYTNNAILIDPEAVFALGEEPTIDGQTLAQVYVKGYSYGSFSVKEPIDELEKIFSGKKAVRNGKTK